MNNQLDFNLYSTNNQTFQHQNPIKKKKKKLWATKHISSSTNKDPSKSLVRIPSKTPNLLKKNFIFSTKHNRKTIKIRKKKKKKIKAPGWDCKRPHFCAWESQPLPPWWWYNLGDPPTLFLLPLLQFHAYPSSSSPPTLSFAYYYISTVKTLEKEREREREAKDLFIIQMNLFGGVFKVFAVERV